MTMQALDQELRWTTPVEPLRYEVKVPVGAADRLATAARQRSGRGGTLN